MAGDPDYTDSYEDVSMFSLSDERERAVCVIGCDHRSAATGSCNSVPGTELRQ